MQPTLPWWEDRVTARTKSRLRGYQGAQRELARRAAQSQLVIYSFGSLRIVTDERRLVAVAVLASSTAANKPVIAHARGPR